MSFGERVDSVAQQVADDLQRYFNIRRRDVPPCEFFARAMSPVKIDQWQEPRRQTALVLKAATIHRDAIRESGEWPKQGWPFAKRLSRALWSLARMWAAAALYTCHIQRVIDCTGDCEVLAQYCAT